MPNAAQLIRDDHRDILALFVRVQQAPDADRRKHAAQRIAIELETHAELEEEIFYPWVRALGGGANIIDVFGEEHRAAKRLALELARLDAENPHFEARALVLKEHLELHMQKEETQILPFVEDAGAVMIEDVGRRMAQRRPELRKRNTEIVEGGLIGALKGAVEQVREALARR